jgi:hypothetical protein
MIGQCKRALGLCVILLWVGLARAEPAQFQGTQGPVPAAVAERMRGGSWRQGCPVPITDLAYLRLSHHGRDGAVHTGELVVHRGLAAQVLEIFKALFAQRFPIEKMRLIDEYQGDDDRSMADNNTSGFNCREVQGKPKVLSKHASGRAIDINPLWNPMLVGITVMPPAGAEFRSRDKAAPGLLRKDDPAVREFKSRGWIWGGDWVSMKDYQHFQK